MIYVYQCNKCRSDLESSLGHEITNVDELDGYAAAIFFETSHSMEPTKKELAAATVCPRCNGKDCIKSSYGSNNICYIRGNGYLDKAGVRRDMDTYHLTQQDPYGEYRVPGEVDDMKTQIKKKGQHNPHTKTFAPTSDMQQAVTRAINKPSE